MLSSENYMTIHDDEEIFSSKGPSNNINRNTTPQAEENNISQNLFEQAAKQESQDNKHKIITVCQQLKQEIQNSENHLKELLTQKDSQLCYNMFLKENDSIRKKLIEINNKISNISIPNPLKKLHTYELKLDFDLKDNKDLSYTIPFQVNHLGKKWIFWLKKRDNKIEFIIDFFLHQKQMNINEIQANLNLKFSLYWYENNQINSSNMIISNRKFEQK